MSHLRHTMTRWGLFGGPNGQYFMSVVVFVAIMAALLLAAAYADQNGYTHEIGRLIS